MDRLRTGTTRERRSTWARALFACVLAGVILGSHETAWTQAAAAPVPFRICFSRSTTGDISYNDAVAALTSWGRVVVEDSAVPLDLSVDVTDQTTTLVEDFDAGRLEAISVSATEFLRVRNRPDSMLVMEARNQPAIRYVLLVRADAGLTLPQVLGATAIAHHRTAATALAPAWIQGLAAQYGVKEPSLGDTPGGAKAILRVFFKQSAACVATESGFQLACELNPQLGKALKVLEISPPILPTAVLIHRAVREDIRQSIYQRVSTLRDSARGRQILTVFQVDGVRPLPISEWERTLELVSLWTRGTDGQVTPSEGALGSQRAAERGPR